MKTSLLHLHLAVLLWGFTGVLGRAISLSPPVLVWYRMLIAAAILALIITRLKLWQPFRRKDLLTVFGIGILFSVHWIAFFGSIKNANASVAMICLATAGIFTAIFYPLVSGTRFNISELLFGLIAIAGVWCMYAFRPDEVEKNMNVGNMPNFGKGVLLGVVAALISAVFTIMNKPLTQRYNHRTLVFYEMIAGWGFITLLAPFYIMNAPEQALIPQQWDYLWLFLLGYCCTVWGQSLAMNSLRNLSPFMVTLSVNLEPIYGIILAFIFYKENRQLGWGFYVGVALILLSIVLQTLLIFYKQRRIPVSEIN